MESRQGEANDPTFESLCEKRVSFVFPTKNRAEYLASALERYRSLKGPDDEIIVVDGGSTDSTRDVAERYKDVIDIFISEPDESGPNAINKGIVFARGRYTQLLTDDDKFFKEGIDHVVKVMDENPEIDLLVCGGTKEKDGRKMGSKYIPSGIPYGKHPEDAFRYKAGAGLGLFTRRKSFARMGQLMPCEQYLTHLTDLACVAAFIKKGGIVKFCRVRLYHHIIYQHGVSVKREGSGADRRVVREYCSYRFYLRYCMWRFLKEHQSWFGSLHSFIWKTVPKNVVESWDGGLSW
ncbi:MAG: glycosyltransferase [Candidatus Sungbacteria bacterium]|nr:glycosyltransferase [Candidatus Sungbacteria bacterium]